MKNFLRVIEAKNLRFLAIALLVLAMVFSVVSCSNDATTGGPGGNGPGDGPAVTVTGIPSRYNGQYGHWSTITGNEFPRSINQAIQISNGRVTMPSMQMLGPNEIYYGNGTYTIQLNIYNSTTFISTDFIAAIRWNSVSFNNGSATVDWSNGTVLLD